MMKNRSEAVPRTPAQRGQIIQRVIVDGWTCAEAAAAAGIPEKLVDAWVGAFRRHGMASLRHAARMPAGGAIVQLCLRPVPRGWAPGAWTVIANRLGRWFWSEHPTRAASVRHSQDDRRGGS